MLQFHSAATSVQGVCPNYSPSHLMSQLVLCKLHQLPLWQQTCNVVATCVPTNRSCDNTGDHWTHKMCLCPHQLVTSTVWHNQCQRHPSHHTRKITDTHMSSAHLNLDSRLSIMSCHTHTHTHAHTHTHTHTHTAHTHTHTHTQPTHTHTHTHTHPHTHTHTPPPSTAQHSMSLWVAGRSTTRTPPTPLGTPHSDSTTLTRLLAPGGADPVMTLAQKRVNTISRGSNSLQYGCGFPGLILLVLPAGVSVLLDQPAPSLHGIHLTSLPSPTPHT